MKECNLDPEIRLCTYAKGGTCYYPQKCSFQQEQYIERMYPVKEEYKRPERWYARYTMGRR